jgi:type I restriction enzyme S subunit
MFATRLQSSLAGGKLIAEYYWPQHIADDLTLRRWETATLDNLRDSDSPISYGVLKPDDKGDKFRVAKFENFDGMFVCASDCDAISEQMFYEFRRSQAIAGDILIAIGGYVGRPAIVQPVDPSYQLNINRHLARFRVDQEKIDVHYALAYLSSPIGERQLRRQVTGSVQAGINLEDLRLVSIPIVSRPVQKYVGDIVRRAEKLRHFSMELQRSLDSDCESLIPVPVPILESRHVWRPASTDIEPIRLDPKYYDPKYLAVAQQIDPECFKPLGHIVSDIRYGSSVPANYVKRGEGLLFIRGFDLTRNRIRYNDSVDICPSLLPQIGSNILREGELLFTRSGTVGITSVVPSEVSGAGFGSFMMAMKPSSEVDPYYLSWFLNSWLGRNQVSRRENGAIQQNVNIQELSSIQVWLPPPNIQNRISSLVRKWQRAVALTEVLVQTAKIIAGDLVYGKITEEEILDACGKADPSGDREILSRLYAGGIDATDTQPLFQDLDSYYETLQMAEKMEVMHES